MIVAITGTPGTGKTSVAEKLSEITGWELIGLNELAEKKRLYTGFDNIRQCNIVDIGAIKRELKNIASEKRNIIIESHYAHDMDPDLVVVLRACAAELRKRGAEKGWEKEKTEENVIAEIMEECKLESIEEGKATREFDTTGKTPGESARGVAAIMQEEGMFLNRDVKIPSKLKEKLREPYGKLFPDVKKAAPYMKGSEIISVGDFVSYELYSAGILPKIFVTDGIVRRKPYKKTIPLDYEKLKAKNPPGLLTHELWNASEKALSEKAPVRIEVDGEEDMAVLPFMIMAKDGTSVIYGLFGKGVCVIKVNREVRKTGRNLLRNLAGSR